MDLLSNNEGFDGGDSCVQHQNLAQNTEHEKYSYTGCPEDR